jgi:hypothetical protein
METVEGEAMALAIKDPEALGPQENHGAGVFLGIEEEGSGPEAQPHEAGSAVFGTGARGEARAKNHGQSQL